jgi:hypothetical protein
MARSKSINKLADNLIINPSFDIFQRGTSYVGIASATYTADRWVYFKNGTMVQESAKNSDVPTGVEGASLYTQVTTAQPSLGAGDFVIYAQHIEGYNLRKIKDRDFILGFWVKSPKTGVHCVSFRNDLNDRSYVTEYTVDAVDTWEYKTIRVKHDSTGTWDYENGAGMKVSWCHGAGTTFQTTADSWQGGNYLATANQVNTLDTNGNTFKIAQVQLHEGIEAADFDDIKRDFGTEVQMCQRYYEKTYNLDVAPGTATSVGARNCAGRYSTSNDVFEGTSWITIKRAVPTVVTYDVSGSSPALTNFLNISEAGSAIGGSATSASYHFTVEAEI